MGYANPVHRARVFERALAGGRRTYQEVATEFGVTSAAVCQYLAIVNRLPPEAVRALEAERDPARLRKTSMKALVRIARMRDDDARWAALAALLSGEASDKCNLRREETCAR